MYGDHPAGKEAQVLMNFEVLFSEGDYVPT